MKFISYFWPNIHFLYFNSILNVYISGCDYGLLCTQDAVVLEVGIVLVNIIIVKAVLIDIFQPFDIWIRMLDFQLV